MPRHLASPLAVPGRVAAALVLAALVATPRAAIAQRPAASASAPLVVSDAWLAQRLGRDTSLVLLHVAASRGEYDAGHIVGARFLGLDDYAPANRADTLERELPSPAALRALLEPLGVADGRRVVVIGQPLPAARFAFTMAAMGREAMVSVLDGGIDTWRERGRPVVHDTLPPLDATRRGTLTLAPVATLVATTADVVALVAADSAAPAPVVARPAKGRRAAPRTQVVDARAPEFYQGTSSGNLPRSGHIPGARSVPLPSLSGAAGTLRDTAAIRARFAAAGIAPRDTVVSYCFIGMQGSLLWLQARRLGHPARLYDASFTAWSRNRALPVATGPAPR
jgi:thiosulfate/3-mercaptopyruvate sulfurtransferase